MSQEFATYVKQNVSTHGQLRTKREEGCWSSAACIGAGFCSAVEGLVATRLCEALFNGATQREVSVREWPGRFANSAEAQAPRLPSKWVRIKR
jgi:hypothetical protein